jgi:hypothetical protein
MFVARSEPPAEKRDSEPATRSLKDNGGRASLHLTATYAIYFSDAGIAQSKARGTRCLHACRLARGQLGRW